MTEHDEPQAPEVVKVSRDLTELERLAGELHAQAVDDSNSRLMPGGKAMVALAPVASVESWEFRQQSTERTGKAYTNAEDEDPDDVWPPLQTLLFWTEQLRRERGEEYGQRPTIASEAGYLRWLLPVLWETETGWDDMAADVRRARTRLEDTVHDGKRNQAGVRCFDCDVDLMRFTRNPRRVHHCDGHEGVCILPHRYCPHDRGGLSDEWVCPSCERRYDAESYRRAVSHAHFVHAEYLTLTEVIDRTGVPRGSIQGWATRGVIRKRKDLNTGRMTYNVDDVLTRGESDLAS